MEQLIKQSLAYYTFPFTVMLVICLVYWLVAILTGVGDFDADVDTDIDADVDVDADADTDADADGSGIVGGFVDFITLGEAPITVAVTILTSAVWYMSVQINMMVNPSANLLIGFGILLPILFISTFITRQVVKPIAKLFKLMNDVEKVGDKTIGGICIARNTITNKGGFAEIKTDTSPIQINVYTDGEEVIEKGGRALVLEFNETKNRYLIQTFTEEI